PARSSLVGPLVEGCQGGVIERNGALGVELAERNSQPGAVAAVVGQAVEFEVQQLAEPEAGAAQDRDGAPGRDIVETSDRCHEIPVIIGWQGAGDSSGEPWEVAAPQQRTGGSVGPAPQSDVLEEPLEGRDGVVLASDGDRL